MAIKITAIGNEYSQKIIQAINNQECTFNLEYFESVRRWVLGFEFQGFTRHHLPILPQQGLLEKWRNVLGFDLLCITEDNLPPFDIDAFTLGNASNESSGLFILQGEELQQFDNLYYAIR